MKRAILTGASGFIGRHAISHMLARGFEVHALSRHPHPVTGPPGLHWHRANVFDLEGVRDVVAQVQPSHLLHCAWYAEPGLFWRSQENYRWLAASVELVRAFCDAGGERVVGVGTCAEYDWRLGICSEELTARRPTTPYGICKNALADVLASLGSEAGISVAWGRVFFLYGPHEHRSRLVPSVATAVLAGQVARCTHGRQLRDFLHVSDCADALSALLDSDVVGAVNLGSGTPVAIEMVVKAVAAAAGRADLLALGARPAVPGEPPIVVADVTRLRDEVQWNGARDLQTGLADTVAWWRRHEGGQVGGAAQA